MTAKPWWPCRATRCARKGDKSLVGNKGYRKYLRAGGKQFAVDEDKIKAEARHDGKWGADDEHGFAGA